MGKFDDIATRLAEEAAAANVAERKKNQRETAIEDGKRTKEEERQARLKTVLANAKRSFDELAADLKAKKIKVQVADARDPRARLLESYRPKTFRLSDGRDVEMIIYITTHNEWTFGFGCSPVDEKASIGSVVVRSNKYSTAETNVHASFDDDATQEQIDNAIRGIFTHVSLKQ